MADATRGVIGRARGMAAHAERPRVAAACGFAELAFSVALPSGASPPRKLLRLMERAQSERVDSSFSRARASL